MKNKIILTSIIAVMVACPAFAVLGPGETDPYSADCIGAPIAGAEEGTVIYTAGYSACTSQISYGCGEENNTAISCTITQPATQSITSGVAFTAASAEYTGHTFSGWLCDYNLTTGAAQANYSLPDTIAANSFVVPCQNNVSCTAQWDTNNYKVKYKGCGVTDNNAIESGNVAYGASYTILPAGEDTTASGGLDLTSIAPATGHHYVNSKYDWVCKDINDNTITPNDNHQITMPASNVTCTMTCDANTITLVWKDWNGTVIGTNLGNAGSCIYGKEASDEDSVNPIHDPTRAGYQFTGWTPSHE